MEHSTAPGNLAESQNQGWNGDSYEVDTAASELDSLTGQSAPTAASTAPSLAFTTAQTIDCAAEAANATVPTFSAGASDAACDGLMLDQDARIECHTVAGIAGF